MPAPSNADEFLDLVQKSGILDNHRISTYLARLQNANAITLGEPAKCANLLVRDGILTNFQAEQFLLGKWRRFTIGKYKVIERLGSGNNATVYLCEHKLLLRWVAVKVLPTVKAEDEAALQGFYREARALAALDHPNIVRCIDIDQDEKVHFLVMEYVDGSSLQEITERFGPMDVTRASHYVRQAALGLQHAHKRAGIVHRGIKPSDILVDRGGGVKIIDMGFVRYCRDREDNNTEEYDADVLGPAEYVAPEQTLDCHNVDIRADIYSLGATFYFCLTGKTLFDGGSITDKLTWHQAWQPKPVRQLRPEVPEELAALIERMIAIEPGHRPQTPKEVADALAPYTEGPINAPPSAEMPCLCPALSGVAMAGGERRYYSEDILR